MLLLFKLLCFAFCSSFSVLLIVCVVSILFCFVEFCFVYVSLFALSLYDLCVLRFDLFVVLVDV